MSARESEGPADVTDISGPNTDVSVLTPPPQIVGMEDGFSFEAEVTNTTDTQVNGNSYLFNGVTTLTLGQVSLPAGEPVRVAVSVPPSAMGVLFEAGSYYNVEWGISGPAALLSWEGGAVQDVVDDEPASFDKSLVQITDCTLPKTSYTRDGDGIEFEGMVTIANDNSTPANVTVEYTVGEHGIRADYTVASMSQARFPISVPLTADGQLEQVGTGNVDVSVTLASIQAG